MTSLRPLVILQDITVKQKLQLHRKQKTAMRF